MNKRITSLLLCLLMVVALLVTAVPTLAAGNVKFTMTADKAEASPGDTITYTVTMGAVSRFDSLKYKLSIPAGLTFVPESGKLADNLKETLNCVDTAWTESTKVFYITLCSDGIGYTSTTPTELMKFQCKVDDGATGNLKIDFIIDPDNCYDVDFDNIAFTTETPTVKVIAAPKPATDIKLNKNTTTIYTGSTETLVPTVEPTDTTDAVTWESDNTSVATVDNTGKVTAVAPGKATITVKAGSKSAACVVTVENAPCTHAKKTPVPAKDSTCKDKGWDEYEKCDDCGAILTSDGQIPFRALSTNHTGGTATCTEKAVCTVCNKPYGNTAAHSYTAETKKAEALKTAGTCKDEAVYYYSCSECGTVEHNDSHTFKGDKDAAKHAGATYLKNQKEATCKDKGYTGDTYCLDCNEKIKDGTVIEKSAHNPASVWSHNDTKHWKECDNVVGCGVKLNEGDHTSTGENVATCQHKAVCDVCGTLYGKLADHSYSAAWSYDSTNHWHVCTACGDKKDIAAHTPDREAATVNDPIKCIDCGYEIAPQIGTAKVELPFTVTVKQGGNVAPGKQVFELEIFDIGNSTEELYSDVTYTATVETNGKGDYNAKLVITGPEDQVEQFVCEGFYVREKNTGIANWTYSDAVWYVMPIDTAEGTEYLFYPAVLETSDNGEYYVFDRANQAEQMTFENIYTENKAIEPTEPTKPIEPTESTKPTTPTKPAAPTNPNNNQKSPKTGDNSNMILWIALLFVCGGAIAGTTVYYRKRTSVK